jgi:hypothetical protein
VNDPQPTWLVIRETVASVGISAPSQNTAATQGWNNVNQMLRSVLAHPLGFPLLLLFDYLEKNENDSVQVWNESNLGDVKDLVYLDAAHLRLLQAVKHASSARDAIVAEISGNIKAWHADEKDRKKTTLTEGISDALNKTWATRDRLVSSAEVPAVNNDISGRCDVVLYDTVADNAPAGGDPRRSSQLKDQQHQSARPPPKPVLGKEMQQIREENRAVALLEFGKHNRLWWKKYDQCSQYVTQKLTQNGGNMPLLVAAISYDFQVDESMFEFKIAAFLCWGKKGRERTILLWRKSERGLDAFIKSISTVAAIALCLRQWHPDAYPQELYKVLGPNCSRVATKVCL